MPDGYLLENGVDRYLLEDGTGIYLLESIDQKPPVRSRAVPMGDHAMDRAVYT